MTAPSDLAARLQGPQAIRSALLFVACGALLYFGALSWTGWGEASAAIRKLGPATLLGGAAVASTAYLWRFARWDYALACFGHRVPRRRGLLIYVAGLALTTSPGKLGETLRSVLLLPCGVRPGHSLGAFVADRSSDVLGMCLLGALAAAAGGGRAWMLAALAAGLGTAGLLGSHALRHPAAGNLWDALAHRLRWLPVRGGEAALSAWATLWTPRRAAAFALVAVVAYGTQALVFAWFCALAGIAVAIPDAVLIFVNATLFGAASMVPGGLGAMEAALVFQLAGHGADEAAAVSVAIGTRLVTLWLGVALGLAALLSVRRNGGPSGVPRSV